MRADDYIRLNVLCVLWSEDKINHKGRIQPIHIETETGETFHVEEIRMHTLCPRGHTVLHQFTVYTKEGHYLDIWLDMHTLTWFMSGAHTKEGRTLDFFGKKRRVV